MDYQVVWSPEAVADVEAIASYIARDSAAYGQAVVEKILETALQVRRVPLSGAYGAGVSARNHPRALRLQLQADLPYPKRHHHDCGRHPWPTAPEADQRAA